MELTGDMLQSEFFTQMCVNVLEHIVEQAAAFRLGHGGIAVIKGAADMNHQMDSAQGNGGLPAETPALLLQPEGVEACKKAGIGGGGTSQQPAVGQAALLQGVLYVILFLLPNNIFVYMAVSAFASGFGGITVLMQWGMVGEAIDYNEYVTGKRTEGSIYGTFNLMRRIGQAIGSSAAVALLGIIGYMPGAETQTAGVQMGIKALVVLTPAVFLLLCWVSLKFVWNITPEIRELMAASKEGGKTEE